MKSPFAFVAAVASLVVVAGAASAEVKRVQLNTLLRSFVEKRIAEFEQIPHERRDTLATLAHYVESRRREGQAAKLTFICTHNSRRSHMAQLAAALAVSYYGIDGVETFSGGTESTAFNPRAVAALERAGFEIEQGPEASNPSYAVVFALGVEAVDCFSKVYDAAPNPTADYCAVMTCAEADEHCPVVPGASFRVAIPYEDPKAADGTAEESARYDERFCQIAREMLYMFSRVGQ